MTGRQDEAVAVRPLGSLRIEFQRIVEQHGCDVRHAHRHTRMTGICRLNGVHGERPDGIGHLGRARLRRRYGLGLDFTHCRVGPG